MNKQTEKTIITNADMDKYELKLSVTREVKTRVSEDKIPWDKLSKEDRVEYEKTRPKDIRERVTGRKNPDGSYIREKLVFEYPQVLQTVTFLIDKFDLALDCVGKEATVKLQDGFYRKDKVPNEEGLAVPCSDVVEYLQKTPTLTIALSKLYLAQRVAGFKKDPETTTMDWLKSLSPEDRIAWLKSKGML